MNNTEALRSEVREIQQSGLLGRSEILPRLFEFLAKCALEDRSPKELEVAADVFGRSTNFDPGQDAVVRVYMHKLRRRLDSIYAGPRRDSPTRLIVPLGDYRLTSTSNVAQSAHAPAKVAERSAGVRAPLWAFVLAGLAISVISAAAALVIQAAALPPAVKEVRAVRSGPVWGRLATNGFPTLIVIGDYYIFGDSDDGMETDRLVREYSVNSSGDLQRFITTHPSKLDHYMDLNLRYLPVGSAFALRSILPVSDSRQHTRVILASDLTSEMLKANNIIYVGYLSGLGALRDLVFGASRFSVGDTYDDVRDDRTNRNYESQGGGPSKDGAPYRDYGFFSTFQGPGGNRILIIAGTRDVGLMQTAEAVTRASTLAAARDRAHDADSFEALYEVEGIDRLNMSGRLLVSAPIDGGKAPNGLNNRKLAFPSG